MKKRIAVISSDLRLFQKIRLVLCDCDVFLESERVLPDHCDICFCDVRFGEDLVLGATPIFKREEDVYSSGFDLSGEITDSILLGGGFVEESHKSSEKVAKTQHGMGVPYPFTYKELIDFVNNYGQESGEFLDVSEKEKCAYLGNEKIPLTAVELKLLLEILKGKGEFVGREVILKNVWGDGSLEGVINVYIHYLRNKLEKDGKKIIISSRKSGYKIDGRYIRKC